MKTLLMLSAICCMALTVSAQDLAWTKDARNMIYNELVNELAPYKDLTHEQKESIGLCGLEEITKKYTMSDWQSKIEVELKRIKGSTIGQCAKNIGVALEIPATPAQKTEEVKAVQDEEWTKEGKTSLYNEALAIFSKYELTQQQRETLSLCFADDFTAGYTKTRADGMIEAELKRAKNDVLKKCLEKNNITLKRPVDNKLDKKALAGCWQGYDFMVCFSEDGTMVKSMDKGLFNKSMKGKWFLEEKKIIFVLKDSKEAYNITYYSGESLKLEEVNSKREFHLTKMLNF